MYKIYIYTYTDTQVNAVVVYSSEGGTNIGTIFVRNTDKRNPTVACWLFTIRK